MNNTCVCCGADIPEGMQVCPKCEEKKFISTTTTKKRIFSDRFSQKLLEKLTGGKHES